MQMTMMTPPSFNNELHYLNKEDRLLRWLLVKHREIKYGLDFLSEETDFRRFGDSLFNDEDNDEDDSEDDDYEYQVDQGETKEA